MQIIRKGTAKNDQMVIHREEELVYLTFPALEETGMVEHLFSTRLGGVSQGQFATMNLSFTRGDDPDCVAENFRRIGKVLGILPEDFVFTDQTHTANVRRVFKTDQGKGFLLERDYQDIDGLVTNDPGVVLAAFFADCVPLYFVDPVKRAIGLSHSGWKGTVQKIGKATVEMLQREFGSHPSDIITAIGPSICGDCYEVGWDVAEQFTRAFPAAVQLKEKKEAGHRKATSGQIIREKENGKYLLDLWEANRQVLLEAGILQEHICITDICTCCNPELLFSHRASKGKRGNLGAFLVIK